MSTAADAGSSPAELAATLLAWYDLARRDLLWRAAAGATPDPYRVWISEIMLQQTTAAAVAPYFRAFVDRWPDAAALAAAPLDDVLHAWQGLGYYARARNLHACARAVVDRHGGRLPADEAALRRLPGVGDYTAAAIAAIAFEQRATAVDGNVLRVIARLRAVEAALPAARVQIIDLARAITPAARTGDFAQALMDLGATVCTPRRPRCDVCPWTTACRALAAGAAEAYPRKAPKPVKPLRQGVVFWAERADGAVLLRRRPAGGLLGGLFEFPSTPWREAAWTLAEALPLAPVAARWAESAAPVIRHTFTHFHLELRIVVGAGASSAGEGGTWCRPDDFATLALPTLMKKVAAAVAAARARPVPRLAESAEAVTRRRRRAR